MTDGTELARLTVVANEAEAELIRSLLRTEGIESTQRKTDYGAGATDALGSGGAHEVLVRASDLEAAQALIASDPG
jgi:Putative prokaryotic signal transducing protein